MLAQKLEVSVPGPIFAFPITIGLISSTYRIAKFETRAFLKKTLNASILSEHPPVRRKKCQNV